MTTFFNGSIGTQTQTVTIANGATTSDAINMNGFDLVSLVLPAALTSTAMSFQASIDGTNFFTLYNTGGAALTVTVGASRIVLFVPGDLGAFPFLKLVAGSTEAGTRSITAISRSFK
jgi:formylmethanofuran:tetrahydromethanopterin formyltransferase